LCGLRHARYEYTAIIDDDLEQDPEDIIRLYNKLEEGYDVVYGIAEYKGTRSVGSYMRDLLFNMLTDIPKGVKVSSFRIMNKKVRSEVIEARTRFVYISMEILNATNNIANITISKGPKARTNYTFRKLLALYKNILRTYSKCFLFSRSEIGECYKIEEIIREDK
jgi:undecaprenyl-phosphate 4-deoxy-4-formamido-L-arabinose transferase